MTKEIPRIEFILDLDHPLWWQLHLDGEWMASFVDLNEAIKYVYSVTEKEVWGEPLNPHKKY